MYDTVGNLHNQKEEWPESLIGQSGLGRPIYVWHNTFKIFTITSQQNVYNGETLALWNHKHAILYRSCD